MVSSADAPLPLGYQRLMGSNQNVLGSTPNGSINRTFFEPPVCTASVKNKRLLPFFSASGSEEKI